MIQQVGNASQILSNITVRASSAGTFYGLTERWVAELARVDHFRLGELVWNIDDRATGKIPTADGLRGCQLN